MTRGTVKGLVEHNDMTQKAANQEDGVRQKWMVLVALCFPLFVIALDNSVLNLALPPIARDLGSSTSQLQWIIDAYILVFATLLLATGAIGDRYGRKRVLRIGLALFGIGSLCAALSNSSEMLIFFRAFSGLGAAMIMPSTLSILVDAFRDPKERAKALGVWASVFALGAALGPLIGGTLLDYFHWGSVFYINLPVVVIALSLAYFFVRESKGESAPKLDIPGILLSAIGLFVLIYGIIEAGVQGWGDSAVLLYLGIGILVLFLFTLVEKNVSQPMLPLGFFKNMSFSIAGLAMLLTLFAMAGAMFFWSQYFQSVQGYSPFASALRTMPMGLIIFATSILSARIAGKIGTKMSVSGGIFLMGLAFFYLSQTLEVDTSYPPFLVGILVMGIGIGMTSAPATNCIMGSVPLSRAGVASAMSNVTRQIGLALGVAVLGTVLNGVYRDKIDEIPDLSSLTASAVDAVRSSIQSAHIIAENLPADVAGIIDDTSNEAFVLGMNDAMFIGALILWGTALLTLIFLPRKIQRPE